MILFASPQEGQKQGQLLCAHPIKIRQTAEYCGENLQSSPEAQLTKKRNFLERLKTETNSSLHISSLSLTAFQISLGIITSGTAEARITQTTGCNVASLSFVLAVYFCYPETAEQATMNQNPLLQRISQDCHLSYLRKPNLNYMDLLCLNYLGKWTNPGFTSTGSRKLGWQHFSTLPEAHKQTQNDLSSLA